VINLQVDCQYGFLLLTIAHGHEHGDADADADADDGSPIKEGWLLKKSDVRVVGNPFSKKWTVIRDGFLYYYHSNNSYKRMNEQHHTHTHSLSLSL
jgi:hypothetical protein